jgi:phosphoglycerol transferase MdoB-like AlkP superfamily enzyme
MMTQMDKISLTSEFWLVVKAFIMGIRFDVVIAGYVLFFPTFILSVLELLNIKYRIISGFLRHFIFAAFTLLFVVSAADIPYFNQFFSRFSIAAFEWMDSPVFVFKMITQEPKYFLYTIPWLILVYAFYKGMQRIWEFENTRFVKGKIIVRTLVTLLFLGFIVLGMRGRLQEKSPIRVGTAYFCNNAFLNQMGLNPAFTLMRSYLDSKKEKNQPIALMDNQMAIEQVQNQLHIKAGIGRSPIARHIVPDSLENNKPNIVVVIMESMSAAKMERHGNTKNLTPFLDSLSHASYYFENIYSAGKHTYNGVFASLFSMPSLFLQHHLKDIYAYNGMASTLKDLNYSTTYFTTHDGQFDNVEGFLFANDFERVVSQIDYPLNEVKTTLGVPDDFMFRFSMPILDEMAQTGKPFFTAFMTASDHGPFYIPDYFKPKNVDIKDQIVEYADWSLKQFIKLASQREWFKNTIFVFLADHGAPMNAIYDVSLNYHHSPLVIYAPFLLPESNSFKQVGGQIDMFPTVMGLLKIPYLNNTLGIDLLHEQRPYIYFNDDDKIGVLNQQYYLIFDKKGSRKLFKYVDKDTRNYVDEMPDLANDMEQYAKANMQVFQYMLKNNGLKVEQ